MAGNTARINVTAFRADWAAHMPIALLCVRWTVSKDQIVRLKRVWELPPRHDRRLRYKPPRPIPPTPEEIAASESSLALAPEVAMRVTCVHAMWDDRTRAERQVRKPQGFTLARIELTPDLRDAVEDENRWAR